MKNTLLIDFLEERGLLEEFKANFDLDFHKDEAENPYNNVEEVLMDPRPDSIVVAFKWSEHCETDWTGLHHDWVAHYYNLFGQTAELKGVWIEPSEERRRRKLSIKEGYTAIGIVTTGGTFDAHDAQGECKYCGEEVKELFDDDGVTVLIDDKVLSVGVARGCEVCDMDDEYEARVKINYCPMCGRKL